MAEQPVVAYSVAYPVGVIGVLLAFQLTRRRWRVKIEPREEGGEILVRNFAVRNPGVIGRTVSEVLGLHKGLGSFILAALFGAVMYGVDITMPLDDGNILIRARFIRVTEFGVHVPELALELRNQTSSSWRTLKLRFDIGGSCNGEPRLWTVPATSLDREGLTVYKETVIPLAGNIEGCKTETIKASLVLAENSKVRIDGVTGERVDLEKQLRAHAKQDAAEAARRKRVAAEQKREASES